MLHVMGTNSSHKRPIQGKTGFSTPSVACVETPRSSTPTSWMGEKRESSWSRLQLPMSSWSTSKKQILSFGLVATRQIKYPSKRLTKGLQISQQACLLLNSTLTRGAVLLRATICTTTRSSAVVLPTPSGRMTAWSTQIQDKWTYGLIVSASI